MPEMINKAIEFAVEKHKGQLRKGTNLPYIVHPLKVMSKLVEWGSSKDTIIIGILHDTLEDTNTTYEELVENFGEYIADGVRFCTADKSIKDWIDQKQDFVWRIEKCECPEYVEASLADKYCNLSDIKEDLKTEDWSEFWKRFKQPEDMEWYYKSLVAYFGRYFEDDYMDDPVNKAIRQMKHMIVDIEWY